MQTFDYKDLEVFSVVAEEGSIRAAALQLNLSQPSVSRRMSRLEQCLGVELLDRSTRGAVLTPAGRLLIPYIERGKGLVEEMLGALGRASSAETLDVWTDATLAPFIMSFVCGAVGDVRVELSNRVASMDKVLHAIEHGPADVAFGPRARCPETVCSIPFFKDELAYVVHPEHPLASTVQVGLDDLVKHEVAVVEWGDTTDEVMEHFQSAGIPSDRLRSVTPGSTAAMLSYRCRHVGVSTRSSLATAVRGGLLVEVDPVDLPPVEVEVHLMFRRADAEREAIRSLRDAVEAAWRAGTIPDPHLEPAL